MKALLDYLLESQKRYQDEIKEAKSDVKQFKFNFAKLENGKDTLDSLVQNCECCTADGDVLTINISKENSKCNDKALEIISQFCDTIRNSIKKSSDEYYAQLTKKFQQTLASVYDYIDELENSESDSEETKEDE